MDLSRVTVFCFAASYGAALALEAAALAERRGGQLAGALAGGRRWLLLAFTAAGLFAHLAFLATRTAGKATPLSSPADWCLLAGAVLAAVYLASSLTHTKWAIGLFLLPIVLALVGLSQTTSSEPFSAERASRFWGAAHGWLLVAATASVCVGFGAGLMYLVQSWRLRSRLLSADRLALPSLEWIERVSGLSLAASVWLTSGGFLSGVVLAVVRGGGGDARAIWTDPVVLTSSAMLVWLLAAFALRWASPLARSGRKVAYQTVVAFGFLAITLASFAATGPSHGGTHGAAAAAPGGDAP